MANTGQRIKEIRKEKGISIKELSKASGISCQTLISIEKNKHVPRVITLNKMANALSYDFKELYKLFNNSEERN